MPRPRLKPTEEQRRLVKSLAATGIPQEQIAGIVGVRSPKTLRKHFRQELDRGVLEANSNVAQTLYQMATDGKHMAATAFWLKCRAGWRERDMPQRSTPDHRVQEMPPFVVQLAPESLSPGTGPGEDTMTAPKVA